MPHIIPKNSIINKSIKKLDYYDSYEITLLNKENYSIDYLTVRLFTSIPKWISVLLSIRDVIVEPFGLKTGKVNSADVPDKNVKYDAGSKIVLFTVLTRNENEIVFSEDDKHLYFRTSVLKENRDDGSQKIHLTTIVIYHNVFGKIYFFFVKPFHRLIMRTMLKLFEKSENVK